MVHYVMGLKWCTGTWDWGGALQRDTEVVHYNVGLRWCI